jgi:NADH:ubiquinone oxidoreductase subunit H
MRLGWLGLFPIAVANVLVTAIVLAFIGGDLSWR